MALADGPTGFQTGDHICALFRNEEQRRRVVGRYIAEGLLGGEKVLCIVDTRPASEVLDCVRPYADAAPYLAKGQLVILHACEAYLKGGRFDCERMLALWKEQSARAAAEGYPRTRVTGETGWWHPHCPGGDRFVEYETRLNGAIAGLPTMVLCQYDINTTAPELLLDVIAVHPVLVIDGEVCQNTYYVPASECSGAKAAAARVEHWLQHLQVRRQGEQETQRELGRLNRSLRLVCECQHAIVEAQSEPELLNRVCALAVSRGGYRLAWIGYAENDAARTVRPMARAGAAAEYADGIAITWADNERGQGPTGVAIRTGAPCVSEDFANDSRFLPWQQRARQYGVAASLVVPLLAGEKAFGAICLYGAEPRQFDPQEVELFQRFAATLAHGIHALRMRDARQLAEEQLRSFALELQRSNSELQEFAFVASHDLQEPLRKITAFGERLREHSASALDERSLDYLARMENAATRMSRLIEGLLQYSRLSTRAEAFQSVDLAQLVLGVMGDLEQRIRESQAEVRIGVLPRVNGDAIQLRQLLQNLLANALKFHAPGARPRVVIDAVRDNRGWQVRIADNGIGFEEVYLDRIFRPFQRLHGRNEYEGSGMGLAICRKIVQRHGATLTAHSQPGQGATFCVFFPSQPDREGSLPCPAPQSESCSPKTMTTTTC